MSVGHSTANTHTHTNTHYPMIHSQQPKRRKTRRSHYILLKHTFRKTGKKHALEKRHWSNLVKIILY